MCYTIKKYLLQSEKRRLSTFTKSIARFNNLTNLESEGKIAYSGSGFLFLSIFGATKDHKYKSAADQEFITFTQKLV